LPGSGCILQRLKGVEFVKANLARFTWVVTLLGAMSLTIGAGMRWF